MDFGRAFRLFREIRLYLFLLLLFLKEDLMKQLFVCRSLLFIDI